MEGWTWSEIDGPRSGGSSSHSTHTSSSSVRPKPKVKTLAVPKQVEAAAAILSKLVSVENNKEIFIFDKTDPGITYEDIELDLNLADILVLDYDLLDCNWNKDYTDKDFRCEVRGGELYTVPTGWSKLGLKVPNHKDCKGWHVAFHGTTQENYHSVLRYGLLRPGTVNADGSVVVKRLGQRGAKSGETLIYASPSIYYASLYAHPFELDGEYYQIAFQVRVKPGSFRCQSGRMRSEVWDSTFPIDMRHDYNSIEWLISNEKDVVTYGLLVNKSKHHPFEISAQRKVQNQKKVDVFKQHVTDTTCNAIWSHNVGTKDTPQWAKFSKELCLQIEHCYTNRQQKSCELLLEGQKIIICFPSNSYFTVDNVKHWRHVKRSPPMLLQT